MLTEPKLLVMQQKFIELFDFKSKKIDPEFLHDVKCQQDIKHEFIKESNKLISYHSKSVIKAFQSHESHLECFQMQYRDKMDNERAQMLSTEKILICKEVETFEKVVEHFKKAIR